MDKAVRVVQVVVLRVITQGLLAKMVAVQLVKVMQALADMAVTFLEEAAAQALQVTQVLLMARHRVVQVFKIVSWELVTTGVAAAAAQAILIPSESKGGCGASVPMDREIYGGHRQGCTESNTVIQRDDGEVSG